MLSFRFQLSIGSKHFGTDILRYKEIRMQKDGTFFVSGLDMDPGTVFYASMRIYNQAGIYTDISSDSVVISQAPYLSVIDGNKETDTDFQSVPNIVQGRWKYSDLCPIRDAYWSLLDLTGNVLVEYQPIPSAAQHFYNDEILLENGKKYTIVVKTIDFLNRTKIGKSDGFTVRIQPPFPGHVRDGIAEDINYQYSTTELSANWDSFGDRTADPTQSIEHYEIAIGNDRRYEKTRSNVHFFVNVGLNRTYTFNSLNLTSKLVRYYITIRAYSKAGGYAEGYSNGIRVGFNDDIVPGCVSLKPFQSEADSISLSWTGFKSDIGIIQYKIGISSHVQLITNDTIPCGEFRKNKTMFDVSMMQSVGLDEYKTIKSLKLLHGSFYFVTVVAEDWAGMCTAATSDPVLVDTTEPTPGNILVNDIKSNTVLFATSDSELHVQWEGFADPESGIMQSKVTVLECSSCEKADTCFSVEENIVQNDNKTSFYDLGLKNQNTYMVQIEVQNRAGLKTIVETSTILIDTSPPLSGSVKIVDRWDKVKSFQKYTTKVSGLLAIANTYHDYICPSQKQFFPDATTNRESWKMLSPMFAEEFVVLNRTGAFLGIGYNTELTDIVKSGVLSDPVDLNRGNYTVRLSAAKGQNIITTVALLTDNIAVPYEITNKPTEMIYDVGDFDNVTGLVGSNRNETEQDNTTQTTTTETVNAPERNSRTNYTDEVKASSFESEDYGIGIHFLGYKIDGNNNFHCIFWARNKKTSIQRWFRLKFDPTSSFHYYTINLKKKDVDLESTVDVMLIIDDEEIVSISGFQFDSDTRFAFATWNEDGYLPAIDDIYDPFYTAAVLLEVKIPEAEHKQCLDGHGFYDGESGIKDIFVGVSDSKTKVGNISPLKLYRSFCFPCIEPCQDLCHETCSDTMLSKGFTIIPLEVDGLSLETTDIDKCKNSSGKQSCNVTAYYLNVRVMNFAGQDVIAHSSGIQIDVTPPECNYVKCLDPEYSNDEPTDYIGSSSAIGGYWNCTEDVSQISEYFVRILSKDGRILMNSTKVGLTTKTNFTLNNGTFVDKKDYVLEMTAVNVGGLSTIMTCSVHVNLYPPDTTGAASQPLFTLGSVSSSADSPLWTSSQTNVGIAWSGGSKETEFYGETSIYY